MRIQQNAKEAVDQAERQCALEGQLKEYKTLREKTRVWLEDKKKSLDSVDGRMDPEKTRNTAQVELIKSPSYLQGSGSV